jgi:transposase
VGRPGLRRQRRAGCEQDPAVDDPDRRQIKPKGGLITQPRRWVVERTYAWMHRCRRLTRQYEQTPLAHEAMVVIRQIALTLHRLNRMTEPPP